MSEENKKSETGKKNLEQKEDKVRLFESKKHYINPQGDPKDSTRPSARSTSDDSDSSSRSSDSSGDSKNSSDS